MRAFRLACAAALTASWLLVGSLAPVAAEHGLCPYMPPEFTIQNDQPSHCGGLIFEPNGFIAIDARIDEFLTSGSAINAFLADVVQDGYTRVDSYGEFGAERQTELDYYVIFAKDPYFVQIVADLNRAGEARAHAAVIYSRLPVAPTATPTASPMPTASPTPSVSPSPSGSPGPGTLTLGHGCATDTRFVRCTVSVFGARDDADLVYEWRFDTALRPETGSTMQLDWLTEGIDEGFHVVQISVRDQRNNIGPVTSVEGFVLGSSGPQPPPTRASTPGQGLVGAAAVAITTGVAVGLAAGLGSSNPSKGSSPATTGTTATDDPFADAADLLGKEANTRVGVGSSLLPPFGDEGAWRKLLNWPPNSPVDLNNALKECWLDRGDRRYYPDPGKSGGIDAFLACMNMKTQEAWAVAPKPSAGPPDPADAAVDFLDDAAGNLPPLTPENMGKWKLLAGWPAGDDAHDAFLSAVAKGINLDPKALLEYLRQQAAAARATQPPPSPPPKPLDPTDILDDGFEP